MMLQRTLALLLFGTVLTGCTNPGNTGPIKAADSSAEPTLSIEEVRFSGVTGARACVSTPVRLECGLATNGENPRHVFECEADRVTLLFQGNLTWNDSGPAPPDFIVTFAHHRPQDDHWSSEFNGSVSGTESPLVVSIDLTPYVGEETSIFVSGRREIGTEGAAIFLTKGEPFVLEGRLSCAEPN